MPDVPYITTDLSILLCDPAAYAPVFFLFQRPHYRLTPEVYSWAFTQYGRAAAAHAAGKLKPADWLTLRARFAEVQAVAVEYKIAPAEGKHALPEKPWIPGK